MFVVTREITISGTAAISSSQSGHSSPQFHLRCGAKSGATSQAVNHTGMSLKDLIGKERGSADAQVFALPVGAEQWGVWIFIDELDAARRT